jgi:hypothetical protein
MINLIGLPIPKRLSRKPAKPKGIRTIILNPTTVKRTTVLNMGSLPQKPTGESPA